MNRLRTPAALFLAAAVSSVLVGCGSSSDAGPASTSTTKSTETTTTDASKTGEELAGRYAHYDVVAYQGGEMKTLIISYGFTDLKMVDGKLHAKESFCHADQRYNQPIESSMSDAATMAIKPIAVAVDITTKGGVTKLHRPETPTGVGIHLDDPANDVLPTDPDDPRVADDDNDGKPGITVHIKVGDGLEGDIYIARRERFAYDVELQDDGSLTGTVTDNSEQLIVGATDDVFLTSAPWVQNEDLENSPILLKPVSADWDCTRLMAERDDLFPPIPTVDW